MVTRVTTTNIGNFLNEVAPGDVLLNAEGENIFVSLVDLDIAVRNQIGQVRDITASAVSIGNGYLLTSAHNVGNLFVQGYAPASGIQESMDGLTLNENTPFAFDLEFSNTCLLYTSPSPRDRQKSRMPSSA